MPSPVVRLLFSGWTDRFQGFTLKVAHPMGINHLHWFMKFNESMCIFEIMPCLLCWLCCYADLARGPNPPRLLGAESRGASRRDGPIGRATQQKTETQQRNEQEQGQKDMTILVQIFEVMTIPLPFPVFFSFFGALHDADAFMPSLLKGAEGECGRHEEGGGAATLPSPCLSQWLWWFCWRAEVPLDCETGGIVFFCFGILHVKSWVPQICFLFKYHWNWIQNRRFQFQLNYSNSRTGSGYKSLDPWETQDLNCERGLYVFQCFVSHPSAYDSQIGFWPVLSEVQWYPFLEASKKGWLTMPLEQWKTLLV